MGISMAGVSVGQIKQAKSYDARRDEFSHAAAIFVSTFLIWLSIGAICV
jgi:hypothetical protein